MRATNTSAGQPTREPRGVSPWFAIAITGGFLLGLLAFLVALERRRPVPHGVEGSVTPLLVFGEKLESDS